MAYVRGWTHLGDVERFARLDTDVLQLAQRVRSIVDIT